MQSPIGAAVSYTPYCPLHEYDWTECCTCCTERRAELRHIDVDLRNYFASQGYFFTDRGRSEVRQSRVWRVVVGHQPVSVELER